MRRTSPGRRGAGVQTTPVNPVADIAIIQLGETINLAITDTYTPTVKFRNVALDIDVTIGYTAVWGSTDTGVFAINAAGGALVLMGAGTATLTVRDANSTVFDTQTIVVTTPQNPVASILMNPSSQLALTVGQANTQTCTVRDAGGLLLSGQPVAWSSLNNSVLTMGADSENANSVHSSTISPLAAGSTTIRATVGAITSSVSAVVQAVQTGVTPWRSQNFGQYSTYLQCLQDGGNGKYWTVAGNSTTVDPPGGETVGVSRMSLGTDGGAPGGSSNYLRVHWAPIATPVCSDTTVGVNALLPTTATSLWADIWSRFSANFDTLTSPTCQALGLGSPSVTPGWKYLFGRINGGSDRFEIKVGDFSNQIVTAFYPVNPSGRTSISTAVLPHTAYMDGQWHRWRMAMKVGAAGYLKCWFDNTKFYDSGTVTVTATNIWSIALGRNMNIYPVVAQEMTHDWGLIDYYNTDPGWV